jgi:hypothetical protein
MVGRMRGDGSPLLRVISLLCELRLYGVLGSSRSPVQHESVSSPWDWGYGESKDDRSMLGNRDAIGRDLHAHGAIHVRTEARKEAGQ